MEVGEGNLVSDLDSIQGQGTPREKHSEGQHTCEYSHHVDNVPRVGINLTRGLG
jgi:hypothetical protein